MKTLAYGYPKLGENRQFKSYLEKYFAHGISEEDLKKGFSSLEKERLSTYRRYVELFPAGELSLYDPMLDLSYSLGLLPRRFLPLKGLDTYFTMARGKVALEMTKWFNTNYHYLVPEFEDLSFSPNLELFKSYFEWAHGETRLFSLIGPYTFVKLGKKISLDLKGGMKSSFFDPHEIGDVLDRLSSAYKKILQSLLSMGMELFLIHEPAFCGDMTSWEWEAVGNIYQSLDRIGEKILLITYYDSVSDYRNLVELPVRGIGLDLLSNRDNERFLLEAGFPEEKELMIGIVSGRSVFSTPLRERMTRIEKILNRLKVREIYLANAQPLYHLPVTVDVENNLPPGLRQHLAFARERLRELEILGKAIKGENEVSKFIASDTEQQKLPYAVNESVRKELSQLKEDSFKRDLPYEERISLQNDSLSLPLLPTTTIGSFPQTAELRRMRSAYRRGEIPDQTYKAFIQEEIRKVIRYQEEIGLDVLVHGEFERTDMVEFFAEKLEGIAVTEHGWVLSYGSRVYRPPIIYGDVSRPSPMTLEEITFAQSLTTRPVKGMLTGPVTILTWCYCREDLPRSEVAYMLALAIHKEVRDLEEAGIKIIQIDEPAFREGAPLKKKDWHEYFSWAVRAFRLAGKAKPTTQIHTHMCYSEFSQILDEIQAMDFDVISIEASRSKGELVEAFTKAKGWNRGIGIGVYDIHSPAIPEEGEIEAILHRVLETLPPSLIWVNPDCGLKTRRWEEVTPALKNMVRVTKKLREEVKKEERV